METHSLADVDFTIFDKTYKGREVPGYVASYVAQRLCAHMAAAAFASQLADPGRINLDPPLVFVDEEFSTTGSPVSWVLGEAVETSQKYGWPPIYELELNEVLRWLSEIPGYLEGRPVGPIGRALGALSYIVGKPVTQHSPIDLTWAMVGLEALYGRGTEGLSKQLVEKTELLLGPRTEHKKSVSRLYSYRSQFLHGGIDIPLEFARYDFPANWDEFGPEAYENWGFASSVLVASLQELVVREKSSLDFATIIV